MSNEPEPAGPSPKTKKPLLPASRIVLLIFVAAAAVVIFLEFQARRACDNTYMAIDEAVTEAESKGGNLIRRNLDQLIQGSPQREYDDQANVEVFTWHGLLKPYRMRVEYGDGDHVKRISTE